MHSSGQRNSSPLQRVRFAAAVAIFAGLSVLGFVGTTSRFARVCVQTISAESKVQSCRPLEPRDPAMLFGAVTAILLWGPEARYLGRALRALRDPDERGRSRKKSS